MACQDVDSGFEALLKPLQDITSKMWDIMLTAALEKYLEQINNGATTFVNFTEAAVLVQNSASFYCKRVDSVHLGCRQFVEKLINTYKSVFGSNRVMDDIIHENLSSRKDREDGEEDGQATKKRKVNSKTYINDNFEPLDIFYSDTNIDVNLDTMGKFSEKKKVILNKYIKAAKKLNTSCPVYQTKGSEMGLKEEFRLHWGISSNGVLNEDFVTTTVVKLLHWCSLPDDGMPEDLRDGSLGSVNAQLENGFDMEVDDDDRHDPASSPLPSPAPLPPPSPISQPPPLPSATVPIEKRTAKDPYKELTMNFVIPPTVIFKKQLFSLPTTIIEEVLSYKTRKLENKTNSQNPNYTFNSFFDFLKYRILLKSVSEENKLCRSAKERRKEIQQRQKEYLKAVERAGEEFHDGFTGFEDRDEDDHNFDDINLDDVGDLVVVNIPDVEKESSGYTQDKEEMMAAYQENRRRCAAELSEVAGRVQAWHESLACALEAAEARSQFDVHQYGTKILEMFEQPPDDRPIIPFQTVIKDQPKAEISRFLLSSLMLANTYNVEVVLKEKGDLVKDCLQLKLLSTIRHHEEMDENLRSNTHC